MSSPGFDRPTHTLEEIRGKFEILSKIGEGSFSSVFKAHPIGSENEFVALKRIYPISSPLRIQNEIKHLVTLAGKAFVVPLLGGLRVKDQVTLIFPYFEHPNFKDYFRSLPIPHIQYYMHSLFTALSWIHDNDILHRDIKPSNCLFTVNPLRFMVIDFGLAQGISASDIEETKKRRKDQDGKEAKMRCVEDQTGAPSSQEQVTELASILSRQSLVGSGSGFEFGHSSSDHRPRFESSVQPDWRSSSISRLKVPVAARAGTRGFRAPEVLMKCVTQMPAIDNWSAGVILLSFLSGRYPFFMSPDDVTSLAEIAAIAGSEEIVQVGHALGKRIHFRQQIPKTEWIDLCTNLNRDRDFPPEAYDLLSSLLRIDPYCRLTAREALRHPFLQLPEGLC